MKTTLLMISEKLWRIAVMVIVAGMLSGCATIRLPEKAKADFVEVFDGQRKALFDYELVDDHNTDLAFLFKPGKADSILKRKDEKLYIDLFKLNDNKVKIDLRNQNGDTLSMEFKGEFETDAFRFRTKWFLTGNPFIWGVGTHDNVLAKNSSGELILYHSRGGIAFVTLLPIGGSSNGFNSIRFKK